MLNWLIPLITLTSLEIVLGIDNIIFLLILVSRLPAKQRKYARWLGLAAAMLTRIVLLMCLSWVIHLTTPVVAFQEYYLSGRDLVLIGGGLFLIAKSTHEIHQALEPKVSKLHKNNKTKANFWFVIAQIAILDIIFSLDSVITAIGMVNDLNIMVTAIAIAMFVMLFAMESVGKFIEKYPTLKMLALSFLILIGVTLLADGFGMHVPRQYIYFAMGFSVMVEFLNIRSRIQKKQKWG